MFNSRFNNRHSQNNNYKYIMEVINKGMSLNTSNLSDDRLKLWLDYARKVLEICSPQNTTVQLDFLRLINDVQFSSLYPYQKLNAYLKYLIEIAKYI